MNQTGRQTDSSIKISDEVIAVCAVNATLKTEGVANLFPKTYWAKNLHQKVLK